MEYYRFFESKLEEVESAGRSKKLILLIIVGMILGLVSASAWYASSSHWIAVLRPRPICGGSPAAVAGEPPGPGGPRCSGAIELGLPYLAALQARLVTGSRREVVCGLVSTGRQEGCSTWVELLARAAGQRNQAVLAVTNRAPLNGNTMPLDQALADPHA